MILYDSNGKKYEYQPRINDNAGTTSKIYKLDNNKCLKVYNPLISITSIIDINIVNQINDLNSTNMCKIHEILYDSNNEYHRKIKAYIMDYYKNEIDDIFMVDTEYIIDNLESLYKVVKELSFLNIIMKDMSYHRNAILTSDKIVSIDFDSYTYNDKECINKVKHTNIEYLKSLFYITFNNNKKNNEYNHITLNDLANLFLINDNDNLVDCISKKLSKCKKPIDYFKI